MATQSVAGTLTPVGELTEFLIEADNPGGTITPFGSVQAQVVGLDVGGDNSDIDLGGTITPVGTLHATSERECFVTDFACVEAQATAFDCIGVCEDTPLNPLPAIVLSGVIIPVGVLTFGLIDLLLEGTITPVGVVTPIITCPAPVLDIDVVPPLAADGDFIGTPSATPVIGAWHTQETGTAFSLWQYVGNNTGRGAGGGGTAIVGGVGWIRMHTAGSFLPIGRTTAIRRLFPGFTPGVTYTVAWKYNKIDVFGVTSSGVYTFNSVADGSGNVLVEYIDHPGWSGGILVGEDLWFERILVFSTPPCPDNLDGG